MTFDNMYRQQKDQTIICYNDYLTYTEPHKTECYCQYNIYSFQLNALWHIPFRTVQYHPCYYSIVTNALIIADRVDIFWATVLRRVLYNHRCPFVCPSRSLAFSCRMTH